MPLLMKHTGPLWGIWKIEESSEVLLSLLRNREEYLPQLELIRTEQRRREWLACRVLLQELTGGPVCVAYRPNGAPYLSGSSLHISISHTKGYACCRTVLPPVSTSNTIPGGCRRYVVAL